MNEVVPEGWKIFAIDDVGSFFSGLSGKTSKDFGEGFPFLNYMQVFKRKLKKDNNVGFVKIAKGERQNRVQHGDILFTTSSETPDEVGMTAVFLDEDWSPYLNSFCFGLRPVKDFAIHPPFADHSFRGDAFRVSMRALAQGSTRYNLSKENLKKLNILLPPLAEQKKIAAILTSVDEVIETTQKQIDKLQDLKKATMNELLTKGIGHTEFKDSELGRIPKSWEVVFGSDVLTIGGGGSPSNLVFTPNGESLFMKVDDFNHPENSDGIRVAKLRFSMTDNKSIRAFNEGTIVIAKRGAAIKKNRVQILRRKSYIDTNLMAISSDRYDGDFLSYLLTWEDLSKIADTTSVPQLNNFHLNEFQFRFPPIDEQHKIASCLKSLRKRIKSHKLKLEQVRNLKKSLMQDLLTGKLRVKVD